MVELETGEHASCPQSRGMLSPFTATTAFARPGTASKAFLVGGALGEYLVWRGACTNFWHALGEQTVAARLVQPALSSMCVEVSLTGHTVDEQREVEYESE